MAGSGRTLEETLALYETAEAQILKGQAWSVDGISYTMPTLFRVQDRIKELKAAIARKNGKRPFIKVPNLSGASY